MLFTDFSTCFFETWFLLLHYFRFFRQVCGLILGLDILWGVNFMYRPQPLSLGPCCEPFLSGQIVFEHFDFCFAAFALFSSSLWVKILWKYLASAKSPLQKKCKSKCHVLDLATHASNKNENLWNSKISRQHFWPLAPKKWEPLQLQNILVGFPPPTKNK